jgi:hypothetical protein
LKGKFQVDCASIILLIPEKQIHSIVALMLTKNLPHIAANKQNLKSQSHHMPKPFEAFQFPLSNIG